MCNNSKSHWIWHRVNCTLICIVTHIIFVATWLEHKIHEYFHPIEEVVEFGHHDIDNHWCEYPNTEIIRSDGTEECIRIYDDDDLWKIKCDNEGCNLQVEIVDHSDHNH